MFFCESQSIQREILIPSLRQKLDSRSASKKYLEMHRESWRIGHEVYVLTIRLLCTQSKPVVMPHTESYLPEYHSYKNMGGGGRAGGGGAGPRAETSSKGGRGR